MFRRLLSLLGIGLAAGCGKNGTPNDEHRPRTTESSQVEVSLGGLATDEPRCVAFKIRKIDEGRSPSPNPPYHVAGGEWTYLTCQTTGDASVAFTVGMSTTRDPSGALSVWSKAYLIVTDRHDGAKFVESFHRYFGGNPPKVTDTSFSPLPLLLTTTVLGEDRYREAVAFSGEGGGWTATKWFPSHDGREAEVYFNYNLQANEGEFREKDADYADDLLAIWASAFRDGPRPERNPANDPTLTDVCPSIGLPRKLMSRSPDHYSFDPTGRFAVFVDGCTIQALAIGAPTTEPMAISHLDHPPWELRVLNEDLDLIVQEGIPEKPGARASSDPMRIWWIRGARNEKALLRGPATELGLEASVVSPDLRYVALHQWRGHSRTNDRRKVLIIVDRDAGTERVFDSSPSLSVEGWLQTPAGFQAVIAGRLTRGQSPKIYRADPGSGDLEVLEPEADISVDSRLSPGRTHRFRVGDGELIITDLRTGIERGFIPHDDDLEYLDEDCVAWLNDRYLKFNGPRLALIDITMMKMCFPPSADGSRFPSYSYVFSPDFRWVLYEGETCDGGGLFLAPVAIPARAASPASSAR